MYKVTRSYEHVYSLVYVYYICNLAHKHIHINMSTLLYVFNCSVYIMCICVVGIVGVSLLLNVCRVFVCQQFSRKQKYYNAILEYLNMNNTRKDLFLLYFPLIFRRFFLMEGSIPVIPFITFKNNWFDQTYLNIC